MLEELWKELMQYNIGKIGKYILDYEYPMYEWEKISKESLKSLRILDFTFNINRIMILFEELENIIDQNQKNISMKKQLLSETILIMLITSIENYLIDTLTELSQNKPIKKCNKDILKKFIEMYGLKKKFCKASGMSESYQNLIEMIENLTFKLSNILPKKLFYQKDKIETAMLLVDIDITHINQELWKKILDSNDRMSYLSIRHRIIHKNIMNMMIERDMIFELDFVKNALLDIVKFVVNIENNIPLSDS